VIAVAGELNIGSSARLEAEFERVELLSPELVIVDLRELGFMDSTGPSVVVHAHQRAQRSGWRFGLVNGSGQVQRLLSLTRVDQTVMLAATPEELLGER